MWHNDMKGVTFDYQLQTAAEMATIFRAAFGDKDGRLNGCTLSINQNSVLLLSEGDMLICGRHIHVGSTIGIPTSAFYQEGDVYCRVMIELDMTTPAASDEFTQGSMEYEYVSDLDELAALRQDDINHGGSIYECELCVVTLNSSGNPSQIVRQWGSVRPQKTTIYKDVTVSVAAWQSDQTYTQFPYKANITIPTATEDTPGSVMFSVTDASSGVFAPQAETSQGRVSIFARVIPSGTITIPMIIVEPEATIIQFGGGSV